jgi:hypothetical protein
LQAVPISANSGIHTIGSRKKVSAPKLGPIGADLVAHKPLHLTHQTLYPLYPRKRTLRALFDHLIGAGKEGRRHCET